MGHRLPTTAEQSGEPAGTRTQDPRLKRAMLYRLSYRLTRKTSYHRRRLIVQVCLCLILMAVSAVCCPASLLVAMRVRPEVRSEVAPLGYSALVMARTAPTPEASSYMASWDRWSLTAWLTIGAGARLTAATEDRQDPQALLEDNQHIGYQATPAALWLAAERAGMRPVLYADTTDTPMRGLAPHLGNDVQLMPITADNIIRRLEAVSSSSALVFIDAEAMPGHELHDLLAKIRHTAPRCIIWLINAVSPVVADQPGLYAGWVTRITITPDGSGLLTSPSTRLPGYITLPDVTASLAQDLQLAVEQRWHGQPVTPSPHADPAGYLDRLGSRIALRTEWGRYMGTLPVPQLFLLLLGALLIYSGHYRPGKACLLAPLTIPLVGATVLPVCVFVGAPLWVARSTWLIILLCVAWWGSKQPIRTSSQTLAWITMCALILGVLTEAGRWSGFGFSVQDGSRFYGIGNESAGAFAGAVALLTAGQPVIRQLPAWMGCTLFFGWPALGANFGAALASLTGSITAVMLWLRTHKSLGMRILITGLVAGVLAAIWLALTHGPVSTHISRFAAEPDVWAETVLRKLSMNITLLRHSDWSALAVLGILSAASAPLSAFMTCYGMLVFNDSGVLAAGAMGCWLFTMRYIARPELNTPSTHRCHEHGTVHSLQTGRS